MEIYLDNAATTKVMDEAINKMDYIYRTNYGNPSSLHTKGIQAEKEIINSKNILAKILKVDKNSIFFTSGGTESNNLAIIGSVIANKRKGKHIITSVFEHPSVSHVFKHLESEGYEVSTIPCDKKGVIDIKKLEDEIRDDTILVSIMHVNNEIGSIQPIESIGNIIKQKNKDIIFHVDCVQSFGKLEIHPSKVGIDCLSISGHKIHGPKGIGVLFINNPNRIKPIVYGGDHQNGIRSGTENVAGIAAIGITSEIMYNNLEKNQHHMYNLKKRLYEGIKNNIDNVYINGPDIEDEFSANHILNIRFDDVRGEVLLHSLESKGIYISTGSACSSNKGAKSITLKEGLGLDDKAIETAVRFSFSSYNTEEDIDYCISQMVKIIPELRRFVRK